MQKENLEDAERDRLTGIRDAYKGVGEKTAVKFLLTLFDRLHVLRPASEYHEDFGTVLWHHVPISEPPYCGSSLDCDFNEEFYTHWSPLPDCNLLEESVLPPRTCR